MLIYRLISIILLINIVITQLLDIPQPSDINFNSDSEIYFDGGNDFIGIKHFLNVNNSTIYDPSEEKDIRQFTNGGQLYRENVKGTVLILNKDLSSGSGIILNENTILTNWHVIDGYEQVGIVLYNPSFSYLEDIPEDELFWGTVDAIDMERDLAIIKTKKKLKTYMNFANEHSIDIADNVFAIGHPMGGALWSFTTGIVSKEIIPNTWSYDGIIGRELKANTIQTQTPINPGNSGGPLFDSEGKIVGLNTYVSTNSQNINFSIRVDELTDFIKRAPLGKYPKHNSIEKQWIPFNGQYPIDDYNDKKIIQILDRDENNDGKEDSRLIFTNEEFWDIKLFDNDFDGKWDWMQFVEKDYWVWWFDLDKNGEFELKGIDTNSDGFPDEFEPFNLNER